MTMMPRYKPLTPDFDARSSSPPMSQSGMDSVEASQTSQTYRPKPHSVSSVNVACFAAAILVMLSSAIGALEGFFSLRWDHCVCFCYVFCFGANQALLDTPFFPTLRFVQHCRAYLNRYVHILTRVTGKGAVLFYAGSTLWAALVKDFSRDSDTMYLRLLAAVSGLFTMGIGIGAFGVGLLKSKRLHEVRNAHFLQEGVCSELYDRYARLSPSLGITLSEFDQLLEDHGVSFSRNELDLTFNALSSHPTRRIISRLDLVNWTLTWRVFL